MIGRFGDSRVTYAIFMRRPVVFAPRLALEWLKELERSRNTAVEVDLRYNEGKWVGAGEPMMYITSLRMRRSAGSSSRWTPSRCCRASGRMHHTTSCPRA